MPLTPEQERRLGAALDRARRETVGADRATQLGAVRAAVAAQARGLPPADVAAFLRAYDEDQQTQRRRNARTLAALDALLAALDAAGADTPGELLRRRGVATLSALLGTLGFAGDLATLASDVQRALDGAAP